MAHFQSKSKAEFWKGFQKHLGYTDQDMKYLRKDPDRVRYAPIMGSPTIQDQTLIIEVIKAHGCANGMKPGDKLVFTGCGLLDPSRSSRWCGNAFEQIGMISFACHNMLLHGLDANEIYQKSFSCTDCGTEHGWGQILMKARIVKEPGGKPAKEIAKAKAPVKAVKAAKPKASAKPKSKK